MSVESYPYFFSVTVFNNSTTQPIRFFLSRYSTEMWRRPIDQYLREKKLAQYISPSFLLVSQPANVYCHSQGHCLISNFEYRFVFLLFFLVMFSNFVPVFQSPLNKTVTDSESTFDIYYMYLIFFFWTDSLLFYVF